MSENPENSAEDGEEGSEKTVLAGPVFDPDLPEEVVEKLAASPKKLLAPDKTPKRREPSTSGERTFTFVFCLVITTAVTALVWFLAAAFLPLFTGLFALIALVAILFAFGSGGCLAGFLALLAAGALIGLGQWLGPDGAPVAIAVPVGLLGLLVSFAAASDGDEPTQLAARYHGHYIRAEDLDKDSQRLLLRVQRVRTYVAEASPELGDAFDSVRPGLVLRDQEWQLARILREQSRLEKDLGKRAKKAMSQTVLDSMQPQFDAVNATRSAVQRRVSTIEEYRDKVSRAVRAQREWEQVEANVARHAEYGDLVAQASAGLGDDTHLTAAVDLEAIKQVRDASVREALDAGQWLSEASSLN
ncbi:hypothetical protein NE857_13525 [Nocardiopsis exhalans]|uniref:Uncharacterized protein n=1 Tax=Nocardiopsis exhalans TaxID=163604 RepID=A0ABY5DFJ8_9ACTN|nr:hypothetical protein [Nocardiopsis exhalans]USY22536.1 hypothetical protein NE857_13525 [Nocardiopsis exhalans]